MRPRENTIEHRLRSVTPLDLPSVRPRPNRWRNEILFALAMFVGGALGIWFVHEQRARVEFADGGAE